VVTDADLLLGRLNGKRFLDGGMPLDIEASRTAMQEKIAVPLGLNPLQAALGVARIADAAMSLSVRSVSVNKGVDPRDTAMIAFGGAGPLHAISIAREIFIPTVIVPKLPGTFSALGMLMASWRQDFVQTLIGKIGELSETDVIQVFAELAQTGKDQLQLDGIDPKTTDFHYYADLRYVGQEHAISIPIESPDMLTGNVAKISERFDREHDQRYGQSAPNETMEIVSVRLVLTAAREDSLAEQWLSEPWKTESDVTSETRDVIYDDPDKPLKTKIYWRPSLPAGTEVTGPAVIEEPNSTILIHPDDHVQVTDAGHLVVTLAY